MPFVTRAHAAQKASSASGSERRTIVAIACSLSGSSSRRSASGCVAERAQRVAAAGARGGARARRQHDRERQVLDPLRDEQQRAQRGVVGAVRVVDRDQQRLALGDVRDDPVEAVQQRELRRAALAPARRRLTAAAPACAAAPASTRLRSRGEAARQVRLEQLQRDAERELALELAAARAQHRHRARLRALDRVRQQQRLADPAGALQQHHAALAGGRRGDRLVERSQLPCCARAEPRPAGVPRAGASRVAGHRLPGFRAGWAPRRAHGASLPRKAVSVGSARAPIRMRPR